MPEARTLASVLRGADAVYVYFVAATSGDGGPAIRDVYEYEVKGDLVAICEAAEAMRMLSPREPAELVRVAHAAYDAAVRRFCASVEAGE